MGDRSPLAQFLKDQLAKRGVSMRAASLYAGLGPGAFHAYINDHYRPTPEACKKIADYLEVSYSNLLRMAGHIDEPLSPGRRPIPELEAAVQRAADLPPYSQRLIAQVIGPLVEEPYLALDIPALAGHPEESALARGAVIVDLPPEIAALPGTLEEIKGLIQHYVETGEWPAAERAPAIKKKSAA